MATRKTGAKVESCDETARNAGKCSEWCASVAASASADAETIAALTAAASMLALASERIAGDVAAVAIARESARRYGAETGEAREKLAQIERNRSYDRETVRAALADRDSAIAERDAARAALAEARHGMHVVDPVPPACPNMARVDALKAACEADDRVRVTSAVVYPNGHTIVEIAWNEPVRYAYGTGHVESGKPRYDFNAWSGTPEGKAPRGMSTVIASIVETMDRAAGEAVAS